jgi:hypothetical protein
MKKAAKNLAKEFVKESKKECIRSAQKFSSVEEWRKGEFEFYFKAFRLNWLDKIKAKVWGA